MGEADYLEFVFANDPAWWPLEEVSRLQAGQDPPRKAKRHSCKKASKATFVALGSLFFSLTYLF